MIKNCTGIIIRQKNWGEKDLLLTLLSEEGNRLDLIAKGAGNGRSKRRSHLELMNKVHGTIYQNSKYLYLQEVECISSFYTLKKDLKRILDAELLLEIIEKSLAPEIKDPSAYILLEETLTHLNERNPCSLSIEISLIKWGQLLGILPNFKHCGSCHKALAQTAHWNREKQFLLCKDCRETEKETLELKYRKALEFFKCASFHECQKIVLSTEEHQKLEELIPYFFRQHLGQALKTLPLRSLPLGFHETSSIHI